MSAYQGTVDWPDVAAAGTKFAYLRASEQADIPDAYFRANYQGAKASRIYVGAYHRARPDLSSGTAQADFFLNTIQYANDGQSLPPMLDIEWPRTNWTGLNACYNLTSAQMCTWIRDFVDRIAARTGRRAVIYTNTNWWNDCTHNNPTFASNPLFIANYSQNPPPLPAGWTHWTFWQYSSSGTLPGDQDVFNGSEAALTQVAGGTPVTLVAQANGEYVTAENAGASPLIANRTTIGAWEQFDERDLGQGYVALRAHANGRYVTAESAGTQPLIADRTAVGPWETFKLIVNPDGSVSLLASANDRYVSAGNAGTLPLTANSSVIGSSEAFYQVVPASVITLMANVNRRYVTAESAGASPIIANRAVIGPWEQFDQINLPDGFVALRSHANGRYVSAPNAGAWPLIADRTAVGSWEKFRLIMNSDGTFSLLANANGRFVAADKAGTSALIANRTVLGSWEKFYRTPC